MKAPPRADRQPLDNQAFTLIEMVVVTALISIMLVVAIPRLDRTLLGGDSDEIARWVIANVQHLREKAAIDRKTYLLHVSPDTRQLWIGDAQMAETEEAAAKEKGYRLPRGMTIDHVAFSRTQRFSSGDIAIAFYPQGYSDKAVIRMRTGSGERLAFIIEPFLARVDMVKGSQEW